MADKRRNPKTRIGADRAETLKKTSTRAGRAKGSMAERRKANTGVKDGTIRLGKSGKTYNVYDASSATWKRGIVTRADKPKAKAAYPRGGNRKEADMVRRPTYTNPTYGAQYVAGRGKTMVNPARPRSR